MSENNQIEQQQQISEAKGEIRQETQKNVNNLLQKLANMKRNKNKPDLVEDEQKLKKKIQINEEQIQKNQQDEVEDKINQIEYMPLKKLKFKEMVKQNVENFSKQSKQKSFFESLLQKKKEKQIGEQSSSQIAINPAYRITNIKEWKPAQKIKLITAESQSQKIESFVNKVTNIDTSKVTKPLTQSELLEKEVQEKKQLTAEETEKIRLHKKNHIPCRFFHSSSGCQQGDKCMFNHNEKMKGKMTYNMNTKVRPIHALSKKPEQNLLNFMILSNQYQKQDFSNLNNGNQ